MQVPGGWRKKDKAGADALFEVRPLRRREQRAAEAKRRILIRAIDCGAAASVLQDPARASTSLGIVVNPVRVADIGAFGGLQEVGEKLLQAERAKDGTLAVAMVRQGQRRGANSGVALYDYEYDLESTRGHKRILNTVTITRSRLYILNAAYKVGKGGSVCTPARVACQKESTSPA